MDIPDELRAYFHDSTLMLLSYAAENRELRIKIEKEIGPEIGIITFLNVSFVSIPDCFPGDTIKATLAAELAEDFWSGYSGYPDLFETDEIVFQIHDQEGPVHLVVAKTISYEIVS
jgi:hypothetical protein